MKKNGYIAIICAVFLTGIITVSYGTPELTTNLSKNIFHKETQIQQNSEYDTKEITVEGKAIGFNRIINFLMKIARWPSLSYCLIKNNEIIWSNSYGFYDLEKKKQPTEDTIYLIASITKTITGTALMQLYEKGLFDLDDDVNDYLPFCLRNPYFPEDPITFRMLLSHSSSLLYEPDNNEGITNYYWFNFSDDPPFSFYPHPWLTEHLIPGGKWYYLERWSNRYRPGERSMYANVNFDIVAYLVELISNQSFVEYCDEHIFLPLGMYNASFNLSKLDGNNVAIPYHYHSREYHQINQLSYILGSYCPPEKYWKIRMYPVGGLYTTISDLSHFFIAHMNNGTYNGISIIEKETVEEMHKIQPPGNDEEGVYFGLAWLHTEIPFMKGIFCGHGGGYLGVGTNMYFHPSGDMGYILFTNGDSYLEKYYIVGTMAALLIIKLLFQKTI